jgi:hypothetical protein
VTKIARAGLADKVGPFAAPLARNAGFDYHRESMNESPYPIEEMER